MCIRDRCLSAGHKTTKNIQTTGAFTVSFADAANVVASDYVGLASANTEPNNMAVSYTHLGPSQGR